MPLNYTIDNLFESDIPEAVELPELDNTSFDQNAFGDNISENVFIGGELSSKIQDKNEQLFIAGEALNALSTPQAVYKSSSDGKIYKTDADDNTKRIFFGFVKAGENVNSGESVKVIIEGKVSGFSGLTSGQFIYLTDTAGSISHTASTTLVIRVGIAISATEILILQKGQKNVFGTASNACNTSDSTVTVTCGFRPRFIITSAICNSSGSGSCNAATMICNGGWSDSSGQGWSGTDGGSVITTGNVCASNDGPDSDRTITIQNITETGFDIFFDNSNATFTTSGQITYIAVGE